MENNQKFGARREKHISPLRAPQQTDLDLIGVFRIQVSLAVIKDAILEYLRTAGPIIIMSARAATGKAEEGMSQVLLRRAIRGSPSHA